MFRSFFCTKVPINSVRNAKIMRFHYCFSLVMRSEDRAVSSGIVAYTFFFSELKQTTKATATTTPPNKRFNEWNNSCARPL